MFSDAFIYSRPGDPNGHPRVASHHVARLTVIHSPDARMIGRTFALEHERVTVGRCGKSNVFVAVRVGGDARIARGNTVFTFDRGQWWVSDGGAAYGTWMGGARLAAGERRAVNEGDVIGIGGEADALGHVVGGAHVRFEAPRSAQS